MDSAMYADDLGVVDTRIADGELNREGIGKAKKVAVGAGALVAGAGTFIGGCKLAGQIPSIKTKWDGISAAHKTVYDNAVKNFQNAPGYSSMTPEQMVAGSEKAGKAAVESGLKNSTLEKKSIFQKASEVKILGKEGLFGKGVLGQGNWLGGHLSSHWGNISTNLAVKSAEKQLVAGGSTLTGEALTDAAKHEITKSSFKAGLGSKIFGTMSNYPILAAAGLAGAGFFIYKGIKKLINKRKGLEEPSFSR